MQTVLNVLLTILKWIGLILLWILRIVFGLIAFVILLVILVLSIPLRFHVKGHYRADDIQAEGMISYFFKLIQARFYFQDNQFAYSVKVFGKTLMESKPKEKKKKENEADEKTIEVEKPQEAEPAEEFKETEESKETEKSKEAEESEEAEKTEKTEKASAEFSVKSVELVEKPAEPKEKAEPEKSEKEEKSADESVKTAEPSEAEKKALKKEEAEKKKETKKQEKLARLEAKKKAKEKKKAEPEEEGGIPKWAEEVMQPIGPGKLEAIWEKIGALLAKLDSYYALFRFYPDKHGIVRALKRLFVHLGKAFHFKPSELSLVYGMDDPAMLAQIMGAVYALMAASKWKKLNLAVQPAFCENRMEAEGDLNFTLVLRTLVGAILGIVINISVWKLVIYLLKLRKKGKKQNGSK